LTDNLHVKVDVYERTVVLPHKYMNRSLTTPATPMSKHTYALRVRKAFHAPGTNILKQH